MCDSTVRKLIKEDKIKTLRLGKKQIIAKSQLEEFIQAFRHYEYYFILIKNIHNVIIIKEQDLRK
ncbi:hypothetical protein [uncultured Chryseobacterium sp.]|uniref:hypothetical protein n=1 Tax=uncultured Chryseobacterium sp. TaxID=259322 RepID=UPI00345BFA4E